MPSRCPWCHEPLSRSERKAAECVHCGRSLVVGEGAALRPIDLRYDRVVAAQIVHFRQLLAYGSAVAGVVALTMPLFHLAAAVAVPFLVVGHLLVLRLTLVREARNVLGTTRRMFTRWITRLSFLWIGVPGYGMATIPVLGVIPAVGVFAGLSAMVHHYTLWSLRREKDRLPLTVWEKLVLAALALLTLALVVFLVAVALLLGWGVAKLVELVGGLAGD